MTMNVALTIAYAVVGFWTAFDFAHWATTDDNVPPDTPGAIMLIAAVIAFLVWPLLWLGVGLGRLHAWRADR